MIIALQALVFFRESLIHFLDQLLRPYYKRIYLTFSGNNIVSSDDDDEPDEQVFAEFDDDKGVIFYPPMYLQRYAAVIDCLMYELWNGKLEKVVDLGCHDLSFIKTLQAVPGLKSVMGVDVVNMQIHCYETTDNAFTKRETPLQVLLFQGNAADPDYRLIGCDAVISIEMIEHMLPHDLDRLVHNVFGFIKPWIAVFTTPNGDFNVLFKALEKNGLRRLDHFFEWTREQFNDWCGNIVARYPQYTVSCKGIGPGPLGTEHLGCCSQMALFVAKDYRKQPELNLNSLALVANAPVQNNISDMIGSWESPETLAEDNILHETISFDSSTEFLFPEESSYVTIFITSPTYSFESVYYKDRISQCNLDTEFGKNFLMFDDEQLCHILMPRRKCDSRVYEIEDVISRLNCTTHQVKKFSKTTQNLISKNKLDDATLTHDVMDEVRQLMQALNLDKDSGNQNIENIWSNFNWGENAPYWNQYYKLVREFTYPYKVECDESRILDLVSDEIKRLIDSEDGRKFAVDDNKFEFPIDYFIKSFIQISLDVESLKEMLEWNDYKILNNVIIYSSFDIETVSVGSQDDDGQNFDMISDVIKLH